MVTLMQILNISLSVVITFLLGFYIIELFKPASLKIMEIFKENTCGGVPLNHWIWDS